MLASALLKLNRAAEALPHATLAYETDPANPYYAGQLGDIYVQQKNYGEAAKLYEKLVRQFPANVEYGVQLAAMYVFNDQFDKAIATYDQMEKSMGVTEEITHQKEQLYLRLNKFDKAIEEAQKLIDSEPMELDYRNELAELLIANERIDDAVAPLEEALRLNPDEAQAHVLLADIYRRKGDIEKTNRELQVVFSNPNLDAEPKVRVLSGYLTMLKTDNDREDAANLAKQLVDTHPKKRGRWCCTPTYWCGRVAKPKPATSTSAQRAPIVRCTRCGAPCCNWMANSIRSIACWRTRSRHWRCFLIRV